jgi:steroid delta-isomerase-like uncharacterized protein
MSDQIAQLVNDLVAGWNAHDIDKVTDLYADDFEEEDVANKEIQRGKAAVRRTMWLYLRAFPDLQLEADEIVIQRDCVALSWIISGTHRGTLMNIPPTGRAVRIRGVSLLTVADGRLQRARRIWDLAGLLRSFGLLPELQ